MLYPLSYERFAQQSTARDDSPNRSLETVVSASFRGTPVGRAPRLPTPRPIPGDDGQPGVDLGVE